MGYRLKFFLLLFTFLTVSNSIVSQNETDEQKAKIAASWNAMERILYAELPSDTSEAIECNRLDSAIYYFYDYIKIARNTLPPAAFKTKVVYYLLALQTRFRYIYLRNPEENYCYKEKNFTVLNLALKIDPNNMMIKNNLLLFQSEIERLEHNKTKEMLKSFEYENSKQQELLDAKIRLLNTQEAEILLQKHNLITQQKKLNSQNAEIALGEKKISEQKNILTAQLSKIQTQNLILLLFIVVLILIASLSFFIYRNYRQNKKINKELDLRNKKIENAYSIIEIKNQEITDSINYAQRIQRSLLPPLTDVKALLPESFILFQPKDIVSGDFYWFYNSQESGDGKEETRILIAAADCTGHGVPGAFMSTIGAEKLNEAVKETTDVSLILNKVNRGLKKVLRQSEKADSTRDGMDIALCAFNGEMNRVEYAGANRPLWIVRKGSADIEEVKATKVAIGGYTEDEQLFTKHTIDLQKGDSVYVFSDGFADQFSPQDKKLMTRKFKEILLSIQTKTMDEQKTFLDTFINEWRGEMEQTDDILVIGIRV
ncbi:MAG: protein serine/threonine phosphatase [Bacteroidetes bacterium]|jgi:serine phosphatase RsbU (regulator of sigma subunit)|nr:protein serine/threonine phosphatase [Bacteroidota bacterium]